MNFQYFKKNELINFGINLVQEKAKMKVTIEKLLEIIKDDSLVSKLKANLEDEVYLNEIEYEEFPRIILSSIGYIPSDTNALDFILTLKKLYNKFDDEQFKIIQDFMVYLKSINSKKILFQDFLNGIIDNYGEVYLGFTIDVVNAFTNYMISSNSYKNSKYGNIPSIKLNDLFFSEINNSKLGDYFDQRYIDYLATQLNELNKINWRKFEQLTAQFYKNKGYSVSIGKGRKDGGIDITLRKGQDIILVQCKRWKNNVGVDVIRALHDEMSHRNYVSGILCCSNDVSRDAKALIKERNYKIQVINQKDIFDFLKKNKSIC